MGMGSFARKEKSWPRQRASWGQAESRRHPGFNLTDQKAKLVKLGWRRPMPFNGSAVVASTAPRYTPCTHRTGDSVYRKLSVDMRANREMPALHIQASPECFGRRIRFGKTNECPLHLARDIH